MYLESARANQMDIHLHADAAPVHRKPEATQLE